MHPLLNLIATRPQLLAEHAAAYADLVAEEFPRTTAAWKRQALLNVLALVGLLCAVLLAGVAVMFWAAAGPGEMRAPWLLVVVPLVPLTAAIACASAAHARGRRTAPSVLKEQLSADLAMLRDVAAASS
jgi:hypothetical protein